MRAMRQRRQRTVCEALATLGVAAAVALGAIGCGESEDGTPAACLGGKDVYLRALDTAPRDVRLNGEVPISDCLTPNQPGGELATVGVTMVAVATELNRDARGEPGGGAAVQLGYLLGAAERGAEETEGIHADLLRRLDAAARYSPRGSEPPTAPFQAAYERGRDAGLAGG
jgi:hypothetical protein